jgi:putative sterol carrier protein
MGKSMDTLGKRIPILNSSKRAKELMEVWPKVIRMEFVDEASPFYMIIENGEMRLERSFRAETDIIMVGDGEKFAEVIAGNVDISHPLFRGQITLTKGTVKEMMALSRIIGSIK